MKARMTLLILLLMPGLFTGTINAQRYMEKLNRGTVAIRTSSSEVLVSWRILGPEYSSSATYNLYRGSTLIASNLSVSNYTDNTSTDYSYSVAAVINGSEQTVSTAVSPWSTFYKSIPLSRPAGGTTPDGVSYTYEPNDASVGDLDGDGDYEIVLKWQPTNAKDNSNSGYTGNTILDGLEMDGTLLWRINLGINIRSGAHYTQFMVYDLDGDGDAEVACKTADGTVDGTGAVIGSSSADYRNSSGYILSGPEYLTVFSGATGRALETVSYNPPRGTVSDWGDSYGNRVDRFLACIAYLDGSQPSLVMCRGYYTRAVLAAWDYRNGSLTQRWVFDTDNGYSSYEGQGNHNLAVGDVDGDGKDEIMYGACAIDDNGTGLYTTGYRHGDAGHLADINPNSSGLEYFQCHESANGSSIPGMSLRTASSGSMKWTKSASGDIGRCMAADIDPNYTGYEIWSSDGSGIYSCTGSLITTTYPHTAGNGNTYNFGIWWDGDVLRELLDRTVITKWDYDNITTTRVATLYNYNVSSNNSTKYNPCLMADIMGDWREEIIYRSSDNNSLVIFSTPYSTSQRMYTLMHDPVYRLSIAWQNVGYNQPPNLGFYFGAGMSTPPNPNIQIVGGNSCTPTAITPYIQIDGGSWSQSSSVTVNVGQTVKFGPQPATGGSWSWSGPSSFSASTREVTITNIQTSQAGNYVATYTNSSGCTSTQTFIVTVSGGSSSPVTLTIQEDETGFCSVDGSIDNNNSGYTGSGFANTDNASGNGITWSVSIPSAGSYDLVWQYANGGSTDRTAQLMVDGSTVVSSVSMPSTGSWTSWTSTSGTTVSLSAGTRLVRLQATNSSGLSNIDYMNITGINPTGVSCTGQKATMFTNNEDIEIYPNPVKGDVINISGVLDTSGEVNIVVYDKIGRVINRRNLGMVEKGSFEESLTIDRLQAGIYFIKVIMNSDVRTISFIKE